ncbi:JAB domain-containing protein [Pantoea ananatis]
MNNSPVAGPNLIRCREGREVAFFSALQVRGADGEYRMATVEEILKETRRAIDVKYQKGITFTDSHATREFFQAKLAGLEREVFGVAFLNNQNELICWEEIFYGSIASVEVHPREVLKAALKYNAAAVILSHNHPGGSVLPSRQDKHITQRINQALALVNIALLDHIIVAGNVCTSMAEAGMLHSG